MKNYLYILILIQILYIQSDDCFDYDYNCLSCNTKNNQEYYCEKCARGYNLIGDQCVEDTSCDDEQNCEICRNRIRCKTCKSGKELKNGICIDQQNKGKNSTGIILGIVFSVIGIIIVFLIICCICRRKNKNKYSNKGNQITPIGSKPYYKSNYNKTNNRNINNNINGEKNNHYNMNYKNNNNNKNTANDIPAHPLDYEFNGNNFSSDFNSKNISNSSDRKSESFE